MRRRAPAVLLAALTAACGGGGPLAPSRSGPLDGIYKGTLTIDSPGQIIPISVQFSTKPDTASLGYRADLSSQSAWLPGPISGTASTGSTIFPASFSMDLTYASPRGSCQGDLKAFGQVDSSSVIHADLLGFENCGIRSFSGKLRLARR